jgi:hypothetical protein
MALVTREVLDRQVGPTQGAVHQQLRKCHGALGYSHGPGYGEARTRRDLTQVHAALIRRATVVDVTDNEVIDLFQDGLYHHRTFEDFGRRRLSSITQLKDMITSWAYKEDKANAKYDAIRGKSKQTAGGSSNNNRDQGGLNNNYYSGPNRKHKPDNIVAAIQCPAKDNSKKTRRRPPAASRTC